MANGDNDDLENKMDQAMGPSDEAKKQAAELKPITEFQRESLKIQQDMLKKSRERLEVARKEAELAGDAIEANKTSLEIMQEEVRYLQNKATLLRDNDAEEAKRAEVAIEKLNKRIQLAKEANKVSEAGRSIISSVAASIGLQNTGLRKQIEMTRNVLGDEEERAKVNAEILQQVKETFDAYNIGLSLLKKVAQSTAIVAYEADRQRAAFTATTGITGDLRDQFVGLYRENLDLGLSMAQLSGATQAMAGGFTEFVALSSETQKSLVQQAATMEKLGVSTTTSASLVNELTKALAQTTPEAMATQREISQLGIALGKGAQTMQEEFLAALPALSVYGARAEQVFRDLAIQAAETGTSVQQLIGIFGQQMDTFEGSAEVAGKLNAVLGQDLFNSTELLLATEAERVEIMRDRMAMAGLDFQNMSKFQQIAVANAAGFSSAAEAAKVLGNAQSEVAFQVGNLSMTTAELEERTQDARSVGEKFQFFIESFALAVEPLANLLALVGDGLVAMTGTKTGMFALFGGLISLGVGVISTFVKLGRIIRVLPSTLNSAAAAMDRYANSATRAATANAQVRATNPGPIAPMGVIPSMAPPGGTGTNQTTVVPATGPGRRGTPPAGGRPPAPRARPRIGAGVAGLLSLGAIMGGGAIGQATGNEALGAGLAGAGTGATLGMRFGPYGVAIGALLGGALGAGATLMADGGIVNEPLNAIVGEAGPEAVIPLERLPETVIPDQLINNLMDKFDELINATKQSGDKPVHVKTVLNGREMAKAMGKIIDDRVIPKQ